MPDIRDLLEGKFARVGISLVEGAVVTFLTEGKREENSFDNDDDADERLTVQVDINGEKKLITPNMTSMRELAKAWGTHTKSWIGKKARVSVETKRVFGTQKKVAFYHPVNGGEKANGIASLQPSAKIEEMILDLQMCSTHLEFSKKMGEFALRINALKGKDKEDFLREKMNLEAQFSANK